MYREFLVQAPADGTAGISPAGRVALDAAAGFGAHLTVLVYEIEQPRPIVGLRVQDPDAPDPAAITAELDRLAAEKAEAYRAAAERSGVPCEIVTARSYAYGIGETLADFGHLRDATFLDMPRRAGPGTGMLLNGAIFDSGRPVILVPPGIEAFRPGRVSVAWDASREAVRAINDALPILQRAEEVTVLRIEDAYDTGPGRSGPELCRHLARHGVSARYEAVDPDGRAIADAIAEAVAGSDADLLVMGAKVHSRLHDLVFGSATDRVMAGDLPCLVLLSH